MKPFRFLRPLGLAACAALIASAALASEPQMWTVEGADQLLQGEAAGVSIDSEGHLSLAPLGRRMPPLDSPFVWALARDPQGAVFAATGNDGKVFVLRGDALSLAFDAPETQASALAVDAQGRVFVGTSPDGKVYVIDPDGTSRELCDPDDRYIWAMRTDPAGGLWIATGGTAGRILHVDAQGTIRVVFSSQETHLTALAVGPKNHLYAGSAPGGIIFDVDDSGTSATVRALYDSPYAEIKALALRGGSLYAAAVQESSQQRQETTSTPPPSKPTQGKAAGQPEVTVTESYAVTVVSTGATSTAPTAQPQAPTTPDKGAVIKIDLGTGDTETIWSSSDEMPHDIITDGDRLLIGTGDHGRVVEVRDDLQWRVVAQIAGEQITALIPDGHGGLVVAASNPGALLRLDGGHRESGTFTTAAKDALLPARWGHPHVELRQGQVSAVQVHLRTGNTEKPDDTWSEWALVLDGDRPVQLGGPATRYAQARITIAAKPAAPTIVNLLEIPYLQRNQRPRITSIDVHTPGEIFQKQPGVVLGEPEILGLDTQGSSSNPASQLPPGMSVLSTARRATQRGLQTFTWNANDPNQDDLVFEVLYRPLEGSVFRPLRKDLKDPVFTWDTTAVPNGRYVVRVLASDAMANTPDEAMSGQMDSGIVTVDNAPPRVSLTLSAGPPIRIRCIARDDDSRVARVDYSVNAGPWRRVRPNDGIEDSRQETYDIAPEIPAAGPVTVVVRATDALGNTSAERQVVR